MLKPPLMRSGSVESVNAPSPSPLRLKAKRPVWLVRTTSAEPVKNEGSAKWPMWFIISLAVNALLVRTMVAMALGRPRAPPSPHTNPSTDLHSMTPQRWRRLMTLQPLPRPSRFLRGACFEFPLVGHDTLGGVLHGLHLDIAVVFELCANGALAGTTEVVLPRMSEIEHLRSSQGPQVSLFDLFSPREEIHRCSNVSAWIRLLRDSNVTARGSGCAPGAASFNTTKAAGDMVRCAQRERLGLLSCAAEAPQAVSISYASHAAAHRALHQSWTHLRPRQCGYFFVRRPVRMQQHEEVFLDMSHREKHSNWTAVPLRLVANVLGKIVKAHALECLEVNYMELGHSATHAPDLKLEARVLETIAEALGNATTVTRRKRVYGTTANAKELKAAAASSVLITEIGTLWSDAILTSRCAAASTLPSVVLENSEARSEPTALSPRCDGSPFLRALEGSR